MFCVCFSSSNTRVAPVDDEGRPTTRGTPIGEAGAARSSAPDAQLTTHNSVGPLHAGQNNTAPHCNASTPGGTSPQSVSHKRKYVLGAKAVEDVASWFVGAFLSRGLQYKHELTTLAGPQYPLVPTRTLLAYLNAHWIEVPDDGFSKVATHYAVDTQASGADSGHSADIQGTVSGGPGQQYGSALAPGSVDVHRMIRDMDRAAMRRFVLSNNADISADGPSSAAATTVNEQERKQVVDMVMEMLLLDEECAAHTFSDDDVEHIEALVGELDISSLAVPVGTRSRYVDAHYDPDTSTSGNRRTGSGSNGGGSGSTSNRSRAAPGLPPALMDAAGSSSSPGGTNHGSGQAAAALRAGSSGSNSSAGAGIPAGLRRGSSHSPDVSGGGAVTGRALSVMHAPGHAATPAGFQVPSWSLRAVAARQGERGAAIKVAARSRGSKAHTEEELRRVLALKAVVHQQEILAHAVYSAAKAVLLDDVRHAPNVDFLSNTIYSSTLGSSGSLGGAGPPSSSGAQFNLQGAGSGPLGGAVPDTPGSQGDGFFRNGSLGRQSTAGQLGGPGSPGAPSPSLQRVSTLQRASPAAPVAQRSRTLAGVGSGSVGRRSSQVTAAQLNIQPHKHTGLHRLGRASGSGELRASSDGQGLPLEQTGAGSSGHLPASDPIVLMPPAMERIREEESRNVSTSGTVTEQGPSQVQAGPPGSVLAPVASQPRPGSQGASQSQQGDGDHPLSPTFNASQVRRASQGQVPASSSSGGGLLSHQQHQQGAGTSEISPSPQPPPTLQRSISQRVTPSQSKGFGSGAGTGRASRASEAGDRPSASAKADTSAADASRALQKGLAASNNGWVAGTGGSTDGAAAPPAVMAAVQA